MYSLNEGMKVTYLEIVLWLVKVNTDLADGLISKSQKPMNGSQYNFKPYRTCAKIKFNSLFSMFSGSNRYHINNLRESK